MRAVRLAASAPDLVWDVVTCVNQRNYPRLAELREYLYGIGARQFLHVSGGNLYRLHPSRRLDRLMLCRLPELV